MKTTKEVMQILGVSRNTLKKRMTELDVFPHINEKGSWEFSQEDIDVLQGKEINVTPEIPQQETHDVSLNTIYNALYILRETGMNVALTFKPGYAFDMTTKTKKQCERLINLYEEYAEADYHRRKIILDTLDKEF